MVGCMGELWVIYDMYADLWGCNENKIWLLLGGQNQHMEILILDK